MNAMLSNGRMFVLYFSLAATSIVIPSLMQSKSSIEQAGFHYIVFSLVGNVFVSILGLMRVRIEGFGRLWFTMLGGIYLYLARSVEELSLGIPHIMAIVTSVSLTSIVLGLEHAGAMKSSQNFLATRACGSMGFGVGAIVVQELRDHIVLCLILGAIGFLSLIGGGRQGKMGDPEERKLMTGSSVSSRRMVILGLIAALLKVSSVPWDAYGAIFLRENNVTAWLALMIGMEVVFLFISSKVFQGREWVGILLSSLAWCAVYYSLRSASHTLSQLDCLMAMVGIAVNCQGQMLLCNLANRSVCPRERPRTQITILAVHNLGSVASLPFLFSLQRVNVDWITRWQHSLIIALGCTALLMIVLPLAHDRQQTL